MNLPRLTVWRIPAAKGFVNEDGLAKVAAELASGH